MLIKLLLLLLCFIAITSAQRLVDNALKHAQSPSDLLDLLVDNTHHLARLSKNESLVAQYDLSTSEHNSLRRDVLFQVLESNVDEITFLHQRLKISGRPLFSSINLISFLNTTNMSSISEYKIVTAIAPGPILSFFSFTPAFDFLGAGLYGSVWRGVDLMSGQLVALKRLNGDNDNRRSSGLDEQRCLKAAGLLVTPVFKERSCSATGAFLSCLSGGNEDASWLVMKHLPGLTLENIMDGSIQSILRLLRKVSLKDLYFQGKLSISKFHLKGFVHRDTHIGNFIVSPSGRDVTLIDFGSCSQISESGQPCIGSDLNFYSEYLRDDYTHFLNSFHHHVTEFLERVLQSPIHQDRLDYKRVADVQVTEFKDIMVEESTRLRSLPDQRKAATV